MSQVRLYLYSKCSSCKNAERLLADHDVDLQVRDFFRDRFSASELRDLFAEIGNSPGDMLSRRSTPYRQLRLAELNPDDADLLELMAGHPALIRRPIIVAPDGAQVGFNRKELEKVAQVNGRE
jgi:regulatory protein spx